MGITMMAQTATAATHSWQPAVSSRLPSTKNSPLRASCQSASHSSWLPYPLASRSRCFRHNRLDPKHSLHPARRYVDLQSGQPGLQSSQPPPLLVHRPPLALLPAIHDLMPGPGYAGPQAVPPQFLSPVFPIRPDVPATPGAAAAVTPPRTRRTCYNPSHRRDNPTGGPMS